MEKLLVSNQIPTSFFGILHLFEFNNEYVIELLKILFHVIDEHLPTGFVLDLFNFAVEILFELLDMLLVFDHLRIVFVHVKLIVHECRFVLINMLV